MNPEKLALLTFGISVVLPAIVIACATAFKVSLRNLAPVMGIFWTFAAISIALTVMLPDRVIMAPFYYLFYGVVIIFGVGSRLMLGRKIRNAERQADSSKEKNTPTKKGAPERCCSRLLVDGTAKLPHSSSGSSGTLGWYFMLANYYTWRISINALANNDVLLARASAAGTFSGWNQFSFSLHNARAQVVSIVVCRNINGKCEPRAAGGQDKHSSGDFEAAVTIDVLPGTTPDEVVLEAQMVAAINGQLAISQINLGVSGSTSGGGLSGKAQLGTTINVANDAKESLDKTSNYIYQCAPCEDNSETSSSSSSASSASTDPSWVEGYRFGEDTPIIDGDHAAFKTKEDLKNFVDQQPPGMPTKYWRIEGELLEDAGGPDGLTIKVKRYEEIELDD